MGDRANVLILDDFNGDQGIYIYSHWGGEELHQVAINQLGSDVARDRWSDGQYLTRILVHRILNRIASDEDSIGAGLSVSIGDNEHDILVIDPATQRVSFRQEGSELGRIEADEGAPFEWAYKLIMGKE